jgi:hypothetical protein
MVAHAQPPATSERWRWRTRGAPEPLGRRRHREEHCNLETLIRVRVGESMWGREERLEPDQKTRRSGRSRWRPMATAIAAGSCWNQAVTAEVPRGATRSRRSAVTSEWEREWGSGLVGPCVFIDD